MIAIISWNSFSYMYVYTRVTMYSMLLQVGSGDSQLKAIAWGFCLCWGWPSTGVWGPVASPGSLLKMHILTVHITHTVNSKLGGGSWEESRLFWSTLIAPLLEHFRALIAIIREARGHGEPKLQLSINSGAREVHTLFHFILTVLPFSVYRQEVQEDEVLCSGSHC